MTTEDNQQNEPQPPATPARRSMFLRMMEEYLALHHYDTGELRQTPEPASETPQQPPSVTVRLPPDFLDSLDTGLAEIRQRRLGYAVGDAFDDYRPSDRPALERRRTGFGMTANESSTVRQEWEIRSTSRRNYWLEKVEGHYVGRPLESFEIQETEHDTKVIIKILVNTNTLSVPPTRGFVDCGDFEIAGRMTNVEHGRWYNDSMVTIEAWLLGNASIVEHGNSMTITLAIQPSPPVRRTYVDGMRWNERYDIGRYSYDVSLRNAPWRMTQQSRSGHVVGYVNTPHAALAAKGFNKPTCQFYSGELAMPCAVRPSGPCEGCGDFEEES